MKVGRKVTVVRLEEDLELCMHEHKIIRRKIGASGVVKGIVPGHQGVWWVEQRNGISAYHESELQSQENM